MPEKRIVYVHGICQHSPGFSDPWFDALEPFVPSLQPGELGGKRLEVLWSDLVNPADAADAAPLSAASAIEADPSEESRKRAKMRQEIVSALEDRLGGNLLRAMNSTLAPANVAGAMEGALGLPPIPGLGCIDDFATYLLDDAVRDAVIARFHNVVEPMLAAGDTLEIVGHSWGTVVAYEGLRNLDGQNLAGRANNFFTVGGALSIRTVRNQLRANAIDGKLPTVVDRWVNLDARGDIVGGSLIEEGFEVEPEHEFLGLNPVGCDSFFGLVNPSCAHSSYFESANLATNEHIFGRFIEQ